MAIIAIGKIEKKLLLPLIYSIIYALLEIFWTYKDKNNTATLIIESFGSSIGEILTVFVNIKFKYKLKRNVRFKPNYFKDFFILFLFNILYLIVNVIGASFVEDEENNKYIDKFYINNAFEIIFVAIITYFMLKNKYYKHHIISLIAIVILSISIDMIVQNFFHTKIVLMISSMIYNLANSFKFCYYKYLIEKKYYYFLDVLLAEGIIHFSVAFLLFCFGLLIQYLNDSKEILYEFLHYYELSGIIHILLQFFINLIFRGFFIGLLSFLILNELDTNFMIIAYELSRIPASIIEHEGINRWIILIISIFQIIFFLFYLEILEYNFCSLNENTKRCILEREEKLKDYYNENDEDDGNDDNNTDQISFKGYYVSEGFKIEGENLEDFNDKKIEDDVNN